MFPDGLFMDIAPLIAVILWLITSGQRVRRKDWLVRSYEPVPFQPMWSHVLAYGWMLGIFPLIRLHYLSSAPATVVIAVIGSGCLCIIAGEYLLHRLGWRRRTLDDRLKDLENFGHEQTIDVVAICPRLPDPSHPRHQREKDGV